MGTGDIRSQSTLQMEHIVRHVFEFSFLLGLKATGFGNLGPFFSALGNLGGVLQEVGKKDPEIRGLYRIVPRNKNG